MVNQQSIGINERALYVYCSKFHLRFIIYINKGHIYIRRRSRSGLQSFSQSESVIRNSFKPNWGNRVGVASYAPRCFLQSIRREQEQGKILLHVHFLAPAGIY